MLSRLIQAVYVYALRSFVIVGYCLGTLSSFVIANADTLVFSETLFCRKGPIVQEFYVTGCKSRVATTSGLSRLLMSAELC